MNKPRKSLHIKRIVRESRTVTQSIDDKIKRMRRSHMDMQPPIITPLRIYSPDIATENKQTKVPPINHYQRPNTMGA